MSARGVGVHSGQIVTIVLRPAPVNTGIVFRRVDLDPVVEVKADVDLVGDTRLSTCLQSKGVRVSTIEHLMSAAAGLGVDNLYVDMNAEEIPIMDGSSVSFVFLLQSAGLVDQPEQLKRFVRIKRKIEVVSEGKKASVEPFNGFKVKFEIGFNHPTILESDCLCEVDFSSTSFVREICRARTFGFLADVERLKQQNLVMGGNLKNAIVLDDERILNPGGLRYQDEFVRHKILDAVGDLYLLGRPMIGLFKGYKSGHALNNILLKTLMMDADAWEVITFPRGDQPIHFSVLPSDQRSI
tara:strand:+ start:1972 stop:2862 length:891 start_codon:yes stop_codon:yes gene_type:complete